jgi:transcriptional regulator with XRE-family HTH domain
MKTIGQNIRDRRLQLGWYQRELARRVGCSQAYISKVEHGRALSLHLLFRIIDALMCPPNDILKFK